MADPASIQNLDQFGLLADLHPRFNSPQFPQVSPEDVERDIVLRGRQTFTTTPTTDTAEYVDAEDPNSVHSPHNMSLYAGRDEH